MLRILSVSFLLAMMALAIAPATVTAVILLEEDFEDGVADDFTPIMGEWSVVDGTYYSSIQGNHVFTMSIAGHESWTDYYFEGDIRAHGSVDQLVRFRVKSPGYFYEINVRSAPFNDAFIQKYEDGVMTQIAANLAVPNSNGQWHHFQLEVAGNRIFYLFDGQKLFDFVDSDAPYLTGGIGLSAHAGGIIMFQDIYYDNLVVQDLAVSSRETTWGEVKSLYR